MFAKGILHLNPVMCFFLALFHSSMHICEDSGYTSRCVTGLLRWLPKAAVLSTKSIYLGCMDRSAPLPFYFLTLKRITGKGSRLCRKREKNIYFNLTVKFQKLCLARISTNWPDVTIQLPVSVLRKMNKMIAFLQLSSFCLSFQGQENALQTLNFL